ncbi:unnamed protein product [Acidithrix sp. C25]|nr:unnamed protein product [Acidithrix sp. C25]
MFDRRKKELAPIISNHSNKSATLDFGPQAKGNICDLNDG